MIRLFIAGLMALMVCGANAATNETLFKDCKKFADNGFEFKTDGDVNCFVYFVGLRDALGEICHEYKLNFSALDENERLVFEHFAVADDVSVYAGIQNYVNEMQKKPEQWTFNASSFVRESMQRIDTCKPE